MPRKFCVIGNWQMNGNKKSISAIAKHLKNATLNANTEVILGCPFVYIPYARKKFPAKFRIAAQDCYKLPSGAFTGEISPAMLKDVGAKWVILGHSNRRDVYKETDELIAEKAAHALEQGLKVIACVGETLAEREESKTESVIGAQMSAYASTIKNWYNVVVAYEPVWAFKSDKIVSAYQAQAVHDYLRNWLKEHVSEEISECTRIVYGGNIRAENCKIFAIQPNIDGFLVSEDASILNFTEFSEIINARS